MGLRNQAEICFGLRQVALGQNAFSPGFRAQVQPYWYLSMLEVLEVLEAGAPVKAIASVLFPRIQLYSLRNDFYEPECSLLGQLMHVFWVLCCVRRGMWLRFKVPIIITICSSGNIRRGVASPQATTLRSNTHFSVDLRDKT